MVGVLPAYVWVVMIDYDGFTDPDAAFDTEEAANEWAAANKESMGRWYVENVRLNPKPVQP